MNDSSQSTILSRRDYIISERNNNRFRFSFGLCTQECVIQKRIEYLLQNQKSANSHQHLSMNTPHKFNHYYLCHLDIPRSVVTYTSNIFFLELSVLVTLQHIEIPFFIVLFFCWKQPNKYFGPPITVSSISANLVWHSRNKY